MKSKLERYLLAAAACLSLAASGCTEDDVGTPSGGRAHLSVSQQALSAADIDQVTVTVSGSGITPNIESEMTLAGGVWSGLISDIPAGSNRTFAGDAFDMADTLIYTGSASGVNIVDDTTTFVTIFLQQVAPPTPFANAVPRFTSLVLSQNPVLPGGVVDLTATASDPDGEMLTYAWTASGGMFSSTSTPATSWTAPMTEGSYDLTISATDPKGSAAVLTASLTVASTPAGDAQVTIDINTAPEVQNLTADPSRVDAGDSTHLDLVASDPDGDVLSFAWTANCDGTFDDPTADDPIFSLNTLPAMGADCVLSVDIDDGSGGTNQASLSIATGAIVCPGCVPGEQLWTHQFGSASDDFAQTVSVDSSGNVLLVGHTNGALPGQTSSGGVDVFVRKLDSDGNELWTQQFGTSGLDQGSVSVDSNGNVLVAGQTQGALPGQTSSGGVDAFVRKLDSDGNELWTQQFGTGGSDSVFSVSVDSSGNVLVAGRTTGALPGQTSSGGPDAFVRKFDSDGNELWTQQFGSAGNDFGLSVSVDSSGNVLVAGHTTGALPGETPAGGNDAFVRKLDSDGNELWTQQFGTLANDFGLSVSVDSSGNVLVAGYTFGALLGQPPSGGFSDAFLRKLDSDGNELWTQQFGTVGADQGLSVNVDSNGNVLVAGLVGDALPGQTYSGDHDAFVRKLDSDGNELWTQQFGTVGTDQGLSVSVGSGGNVLVAGFTQGALPGQTSSGGVDAFVMAFGP